MVCRSVATQLARQRGEGREVNERCGCGLWRGGANPARSLFVPGEARPRVTKDLPEWSLTHAPEPH